MSTLTVSKNEHISKEGTPPWIKRTSGQSSTKSSETNIIVASKSDTRIVPSRAAAATASTKSSNKPVAAAESTTLRTCSGPLSFEPVDFSFNLKLYEAHLREADVTLLEAKRVCTADRFIPQFNIYIKNLEQFYADLQNAPPTLSAELCSLVSRTLRRIRSRIFELVDKRDDLVRQHIQTPISYGNTSRPITQQSRGDQLEPAAVKSVDVAPRENCGRPSSQPAIGVEKSADPQFVVSSTEGDENYLLRNEEEQILPVKPVAVEAASHRETKAEMDDQLVVACSKSNRALSKPVEEQHADGSLLADSKLVEVKLNVKCRNADEEVNSCREIAVRKVRNCSQEETAKNSDQQLRIIATESEQVCVSKQTQSSSEHQQRPQAPRKYNCEEVHKSRKVARRSVIYGNSHRGVTEKSCSPKLASKLRRVDAPKQQRQRVKERLSPDKSTPRLKSNRERGSEDFLRQVCGDFHRDASAENTVRLVFGKSRQINSFKQQHSAEDQPLPDKRTQFKSSGWPSKLRREETYKSTTKVSADRREFRRNDHRSETTEATANRQVAWKFPRDNFSNQRKEQHQAVPDGPASEKYNSRFRKPATASSASSPSSSHSSTSDCSSAAHRSRHHQPALKRFRSSKWSYSNEYSNTESDGGQHYDRKRRSCSRHSDDVDRKIMELSTSSMDHVHNRRPPDHRRQFYTDRQQIPPVRPSASVTHNHRPSDIQRKSYIDFEQIPPLRPSASVTHNYRPSDTRRTSYAHRQQISPLRPPAFVTHNHRPSDTRPRRTSYADRQKNSPAARYPSSESVTQMSQTNTHGSHAIKLQSAKRSQQSRQQVPASPASRSTSPADLAFITCDAVPSFVYQISRVPPDDVRCFFCRHDHWSHLCVEIDSLDERQAFYDARNLCSRCGQRHSGRNCWVSRAEACKWPYCENRQNHHSALCPDAPYPITEQVIDEYFDRISELRCKFLLAPERD